MKFLRTLTKNKKKKWTNYLLSNVIHIPTLIFAFTRDF
jgi:hypothetical protein